MFMNVLLIYSAVTTTSHVMTTTPTMPATETTTVTTTTVAVQSTTTGDKCPENMHNPTFMPPERIIISPPKYNGPNEKEKLRPNTDNPLVIPRSDEPSVTFVFPENPTGTPVEKVILPPPEISNVKRVKIYKKTPTEDQWVPIDVRVDPPVYDTSMPIVFNPPIKTTEIKIVPDEPQDTDEIYKLKVRLHACITLQVSTTTVLIEPTTASTVGSGTTAASTDPTTTQSTTSEATTTTTTVSMATTTSSAPVTTKTTTVGSTTPAGSTTTSHELDTGRPSPTHGATTAQSTTTTHLSSTEPATTTAPTAQSTVGSSITTTVMLTSTSSDEKCPEDMGDSSLITDKMVTVNPSKYNTREKKEQLRPTGDEPFTALRSDDPSVELDFTVANPDELTPVEKLILDSPNFDKVMIYKKTPSSNGVTPDSWTPIGTKPFSPDNIRFDPPEEVSALKIVPVGPTDEEKFIFKLKVHACLKVKLTTVTTTPAASTFTSVGSTPISTSTATPTTTMRTGRPSPTTTSAGTTIPSTSTTTAVAATTAGTTIAPVTTNTPMATTTAGKHLPCIFGIMMIIV